MLIIPVWWSLNRRNVNWTANLVGSPRISSPLSLWEKKQCFPEEYLFELYFMTLNGLYFTFEYSSDRLSWLLCAIGGNPILKLESTPVFFLGV